MWNYLHALWRSVLRRGLKEDPPVPDPDESSGDVLRDELRRLLEKRASLQVTSASYREFDYEELAGRTQEEIAALDRQIADLRLQLRRRSAADPGRLGG